MIKNTKLRRMIKEMWEEHPKFQLNFLLKRSKKELEDIRKDIILKREIWRDDPTDKNRFDLQQTMGKENKLYRYVVELEARIKYQKLSYDKK